MRKLALFLAAACFLAAQNLVIRNANVIDGESDQPIRDVSILIREGKVVQIGAAIDGAQGVPVLDIKGRWILPGWVDAHTHIRDLASARKALLTGVTTARSMGVDHYADVGMRELHRKGARDICDVVAAGYHVRPNIAPDIFLDTPALFDLMPTLKGTQAVRRAVRANLDRGVDVIKILATERAGLPDTDPRKRVFEDEEISAIVDEAASRRIPVAAHAHGDEGAYAAVRAGVKSIEHGTYLSQRTLEEMKRRGTYLVPTIATVLDLIDPGGDYDNPILAARGKAMLPRIREAARRAHALGIPLIAGTDTSYGPNSARRMSEEIVELHHAGMSIMQAIRAGTSASAELCGIGSRTGRVKAGMEADLIVIDANPLEVVNMLHDVVAVINDGVVAVDRIVK